MAKPEKPIAHMLYGFVCAGKTTYACKLERERKAVRFSPDEWMVKLFGVNPPADKFSEHYDTVLGIMEGYWTQLIRVNIDVILDFGFWNRSYRDAIREQVIKSGGIPKLFSFTLTEETARARCEERNQRLEGDFLISAETFDVLKERFQPLGYDEEFLEIQETLE